MPAIDPLAGKNQALPLVEARRILASFGVRTSKPIITQVSRFDPWKDPAGVIRAFYKTKPQVPDLQLLLVGFFQALDDPEGEEMFARVEKHAGYDPDIHLFADTSYLKEVNNEIFVNAAQTASDIDVFSRRLSSISSDVDPTPIDLAGGLRWASPRMSSYAIPNFERCS